MEHRQCLHKGCYWYDTMASDFCSGGCKIINEGYQRDAHLRRCEGCKHCNEAKRNWAPCCEKYSPYGDTPVISHDGSCRTREPWEEDHEDNNEPGDIKVDVETPADDGRGGNKGAGGHIQKDKP